MRTVRCSDRRGGGVPAHWGVPAQGCTCPGEGVCLPGSVYLPRGMYLLEGVYLPGGVPAQWGVPARRCDWPRGCTCQRGSYPGSVPDQGVYLLGGYGVPAQRVTCPGGVPTHQGGVYPSRHWIIHPPSREHNDRQVWKHYLVATSLRTVSMGMIVQVWFGQVDFPVKFVFTRPVGQIKVNS